MYIYIHCCGALAKAPARSRVGTHRRVSNVYIDIDKDIDIHSYICIYISTAVALGPRLQLDPEEELIVE